MEGHLVLVWDLGEITCRVEERRARFLVQNNTKIGVEERAGVRKDRAARSER